MKRILLLAVLIMLAGCKPTPQPVTLHPTGSSKSDCHPTEVAATAKLSAPAEEKPKKAHYGFPTCPDNMRISLPSVRQMKVYYHYPEPLSFQNFDVDDWSDAYYTHATCIPDGM